jgi:hypothetical protein
MVEKITRAVVPGGMRMVRRRLITGSSAGPVVLESGRAVEQWIRDCVSWLRAR